MSNTLIPGKVRIVCVSDTHNDDLTGQVPLGDVFLHAGDMTDDGTPEELQKALGWIRNLPHKVKIVIPGNHDLGLDPLHPEYNPQMSALFRSGEDGVVFIDSDQPRLFFNNKVLVYGNPKQPDFLKSKYAFTYLPHPDPQATAAWEATPSGGEAPIEIWLTHGAPKGRLDWIPIEGLMGCEQQRRKVKAAKPSLCVFGHYHVSYSVEKVTWAESVGDADDEGIRVHEIVNSADAQYDFTSLSKGKETIFVNAAWMTGEKRAVEKRNKPVIIDLQI